MKHLKRLFVLLFALVLVVPFGVFALDEEDSKSVVSSAVDNSLYSNYNALGLKEALAEEGIEEAYKDYSENNNQAIIYLFRGKGCSHCREFLEFLNSITEEYGEYFRVVTFEVWNDTNNKELMDEVAEFLGKEAGGVPFIVIGDKTFAGYASNYDDQIKDAIMDLYNTKPSERYDVIAKKDEKKDHSVVVGVVTVLIVGGIIATAVITRKNNG